MNFFSRLIFVYIFVLGIVFTFLVPPFQKPDEQGHFIRSILLSHGKILLTNKDEALLIEKQFYDLIHDPLLNQIPYHPQVKFNLNWYNQSPFVKKDAYKLVNEKTWGQFMLPASSYIPYLFGIFFGKFFYLNAYLTFFLGRFSMFLLVYVWMLILYKNTSHLYKPILIFVLSLPMFIHQITGYNYDAMHYMMGLTLFVLLTNKLKQRTLSLFDLGLLSISFNLFFIMKLSFEPLLLLMFIIPYKKISNTYLGYIKKITIVIGIIIFGYVIFKFSFFTSASQYTHHPKGVSPVDQMQYILHHPITYLSIFTQSTFHLTKFHLQGIIGIFGWLDYSMSWWVYILFIVIGIFIIFLTKFNKKDILKPWQLFIIITSLWVTYSFMMTIFYLNWKVVGSNVIDGTQGRYFIVFVPLVLYFFAHFKYYIVHNKIFRFPKTISISALFKKYQLTLKIGSILILSLVTQNIIMVIIKRYY